MAYFLAKKHCGVRGSGKTAVALNFVVVFREKYNTDGTHEKRPARITVNDGASSGLTYTGCVQQDMIRTLSQGAVDFGGKIKVSDCWVAYYHGDPPDPDGPDGRHVYAFIAKSGLSSA